MTCAGLTLFIVLITQFYVAEKITTQSFTLTSEFNNGLNIEGTSVASMQTSFDPIYVIVFDAGSTGSRVHILKFHTTPHDSIQLVNETFGHVKPGLSSYAADPLKAAHSLDGLLEICMQVVPKHLWKRTPLILRATAGLRLLSHSQADNILNEVMEHIKRYPFHINHSSVGIMDGVDEGVFSWITVNFLLGQLSGSLHPEPALDLGGGSTQVTFAPKHKETLERLPAGFVKNVSLFGTDYQLYTHSYLGLGLMAARFTVTGGDNHKGEDRKNFNLTSTCIPSQYLGNYTYSGKTYHLRGSPSGQFSYELCMSEIRPQVTQQVLPIPELSDSELYIFSYFFDRAHDAKLIGDYVLAELTPGSLVGSLLALLPYNAISILYSICLCAFVCNIVELMDKPGGEIRLKDFKEAAQHEFVNPNIKRPFQAFDLTYIYSLLHDGYHINDNTQLHLKKKINRVEVSWALGAAFHLLTQVGLIR